MHESGAWLHRYLAGERELVWHELRQLGANVRDPQYFDEAQAVCDEMARRARHNVELLVERLTTQGYQFRDIDPDRSPTVPFVAATSQAPELVDWLTDRFGPIPMTLSSWIRIVGDVWLVGSHPDWPNAPAADPLVIEIEGSRYPDLDIRQHFEDEYEQWLEEDLGEPFGLPIAPDHLHKAMISGGQAYSIYLPDESADAYVVEDLGLAFTAYLRRVFANGGFLTPDANPGGLQLRLAVTQDLLPL